MACIATYPCNCLPGLTMCKRDVDDIVNNINTVIKNWKDNRVNVRRLRKLYNWDIIIDNLIEIYNNINGLSYHYCVYLPMS